MRTQLFRTDPILVSGTAVILALKDLDGADPVTLFIENRDIQARLRTKFGSKNANLRFLARDAGSPGNHITVKITAAPNQAFSIVWSGTPYGVSPYPYDPYGTDLTINLKCDRDGVPTQPAYEVMDLLNADHDTAATLLVILSNGSDGSAHMEAPDPTGAPTVIMAKTPLAGGADSTALGAVTVEISPQGVMIPDLGQQNFPGPWFTDAAAGTALSTVGPNGVKSVVLRSSNTVSDSPVKGLRITAAKGSVNTTVVVTAVVTKKGGGVS